MANNESAGNTLICPFCASHIVELHFTKFFIVPTFDVWNAFYESKTLVSWLGFDLAMKENLLEQVSVFAFPERTILILLLQTV